MTDLNQSHGWVLPRPDGQKAPCGGPTVCPQCRLEHTIFTSTNRVTLMEGFKIHPGDRILLMAPPNLDRDFAAQVLRQLQAHYSDVEFTMVQGFTGVQIKGKDDDASH